MNTEIEKIPRSNEIKAFLIAPLAPSTAFLLISNLFGIFLGLIQWSLELVFLTLWISFYSLLFAIPIAYSLTAVFGIPAYLLYRKLGFVSLKSYVAGSGILGILSAISILIYLSAWSLPAESLFLILFCAFFGAITGYAFWKVVHKKTLPW